MITTGLGQKTMGQQAGIIIQTFLAIYSLVNLCSYHILLADNIPDVVCKLKLLLAAKSTLPVNDVAKILLRIFN